MPTIRLTQSASGQDKYHVEIAAEFEGQARQVAVAELGFKLSAQDQEDLRWYLEDYLQYPLDPAPKIAGRVEGRIGEIGTELFRGIFQANDDTRDLWASLRNTLSETRVEVIAGVREATELPWELIRDPRTDLPLALRASAFVRAQPRATQRPAMRRQVGSGPIRILLVICRPSKGNDVPFRSVASRILKGLGDSARAVFDLDVLRPPTFEQLGRVLREAKAAGRPYHIVHFDGHGLYANVTRPGLVARLLQGLNPLLLGAATAGPHGYLLFENPALDGNAQLVSGQTLGALLVETDVPVLVLNACRSAHAEAPEQPDKVNGDPHSQVRAYGSLAQEVMDQGVMGVVAMRYNVYVVTAAQFVADLYGALARGQSLGEGVSLGRKQLADQPLREIAYAPCPLQDWPVPIVYEAMPIRLCEPPAEALDLTITLSDAASIPSRASVNARLPPSPDAGFFGRDETLLALDRAFDTQHVALLHAYAGSGKTSTAAEFARWYDQTGGVDGTILFTSFAQYRPLPRVLDQIGTLFGPALEKRGILWPTLTEAQRREVAQQVMRQVPLLWIWDNVEPIAGFPEGATSAWSAAEQQELADFLRDARQTKARFLLTSRREERGWLGNLPVRVAMPPMPMQERVQLTRALAEKHGRRLADVADWRPLLRFTEGNPLTITVLVGQALRSSLSTRAELDNFVTRLRAGESAIEDDAGEERSRSLRASLSYGFQEAFSDEKRRWLALLHFFQGFVRSEVLSRVSTAAGGGERLTVEACQALLDRAADIGLLTARGGSRYSIHPALPWYFRSLFERHFPAGAGAAENAEQAVDAFVATLATVAAEWVRAYQTGDRAEVGKLAEEEPNLLHALRLAHQRQLWPALSRLAEALLMLYDHAGRQPEAVSLLREMLAGLQDTQPYGADAGLDAATYLQVQLARRTQQTAEALSRLKDWVARLREKADAWTQVAADQLDEGQRALLQRLASAYALLGDIQLEEALSDCVGAYQTAIELYERLDEQAAAASYALRLGNSFLDLAFLNDLEQAGHWFQYSLGIFGPADRLMVGRCLVGLGAVEYRHAQDAILAWSHSREDNASGLGGRLPPGERKAIEQRIDQHIKAAFDAYRRAQESFLAIGAVADLADLLARQGDLAASVGLLDPALGWWRDAIRSFEAMSEREPAGQVRLSIARALKRKDRLADAREYAAAALRDFEAVGADAAEAAKRLINEITGQLGDGEVAYDQVPARDPYFPIKGGGRHVKLFKGGKYIFSCFTDFESPGGSNTSTSCTCSRRAGRRRFSRSPPSQREALTTACCARSTAIGIRIMAPRTSGRTWTGSSNERFRWQRERMGWPARCRRLLSP
jgi:hypothetical protein